MSRFPIITPADKVGDSHVWREWFRQIEAYIKDRTAFTNTTTVGNVTINNSNGQVIMAASASTLTLTNKTITTSSRIFLTFAGNPGVAVSLYAVASTGSCTINTTAAITNQTSINFQII
jgi:hypothetical protein